MSTFVYCASEWKKSGKNIAANNPKKFSLKRGKEKSQLNNGFHIPQQLGPFLQAMNQIPWNFFFISPFFRFVLFYSIYKKLFKRMSKQILNKPI